MSFAFEPDKTKTGEETGLHKVIERSGSITKKEERNKPPTVKKHRSRQRVCSGR